MIRMITRTHTLASLLVGLLALTLGCNKMADSSMSPGYYGEGEGMGYRGGGGYGGGGGDEDYGGYEEAASAPDADYTVESVTTASRSRASKRMSRQDKSADFLEESKNEAPMPEPTVADPSGSQPAPSEQAPDEPAEPSEQAQDARQIIYTASLQLAVYERDAVMAFAEDVPRRHGGWIQARYDYQITLRVPAAHLQVVIAEFAELGLVLGKTLQADDVTAQYTDLASRIAVLEQLLAQLELLLAQAKTVEDSLKVRQELERVRIELEAAKVQMRQLAESISFSTLTLVLSQRGPVESEPSSNDPFPWVDELGVESTEYR